MILKNYYDGVILYLLAVRPVSIIMTVIFLQSYIKDEAISKRDLIACIIMNIIMLGCHIYMDGSGAYLSTIGFMWCILFLIAWIYLFIRQIFH